MRRNAWLAGILCSIAILMTGCSSTAVDKVQVAIAEVSPATTAMFPLTRPDEFDVALIQAVAGRANLEIEIVKVTPEKVLPGITQCGYAVAFLAEPVTDALSQKMLFSETYLNQGQVLVTKKGNIEITDRTKLGGTLVGIQRGSPAGAEVAKIPNANVSSYDTLDLAFQNLIRGFIDAVVTDSARATAYVNNKANGLKLVDNAFASINYAIAVCKDRKDVQERLNAGLAAVKADGTLENLIKTYLK